MDLTDIHEVRALLARHGVHLSKSKGQNFLVADWAPARIADAAMLDPDSGVLEIGPGVGALTVQLAKRAGKVAAVELDGALLPILSETLADLQNVEVIHGDVMELDLDTLIREKFSGLTPRVCANLPYNITTPLITRLLELGCFESITVMIQKEAAQRMCAEPGEADYGVFSLLCRYCAQCEPLFDVGPGCFLPPPKVTSTVVRLVRRPAPPVEVDRAALFRAIRAAFAQRRKTLLNSLSAAYPGRSKDELRRALLDCGLPTDVRGERLGLEEFAQIVNKLS